MPRIFLMPHTRLPLVASMLAKVSRVGMRENSQPVLSL